MSVIGKMFDLYKTIRAAKADGKLSGDEIKELMLDMKAILENVAEMIGNDKVGGLLVGIGELLEGIGKVVDDPETGVDDLLDGMGDLLKAIALFTKK